MSNRDREMVAGPGRMAPKAGDEATPMKEINPVKAHEETRPTLPVPSLADVADLAQAFDEHPVGALLCIALFVAVIWTWRRSGSQ